MPVDDTFTATAWAYPDPMRLLLVSTYELGHQPLGLASPAAWLSDAGHAVECVDLSVQAFDSSALEAADAVAISVPMHTAMRLGLDLVARIRDVSDVPIALYGLYAGMAGGDVVDRVIVGEYEAELLAWVSSLPGTAVTGPTTALRPLRFRKPDRSGLAALGEYAHLTVRDEHRQVGYVEASHGCRHRCRHCPLPVVYDGRYRIVQPDIVIADVDQLVSSGATHITLGDPDFFNGVHHGMKILRSLNETFPNVTYDVTIKVEHLRAHRSLLRELTQRNVLFVTSAFESTNDRVLELLDKGHTRADMVEVLDLARASDLDVHPTWLPFTPWTDLRDLTDIFTFIDDNDLFDVTEPIQLAIRLLIPKGSLVLDIPGVEDIVGAYDPASLTHPWTSADPRVDRFQVEMASRAELGADRGDSNHATLTDMWRLAVDAAGVGGSPPQILPGAVVGRPRLTEPWFC